MRSSKTDTVKDQKYMSKLNNLKASVFLTPFKNAVGNHFDKLCRDIDSKIGSLEKDIVTKSSGWKVGTKNRLVSKDGNTLQLPPNAKWTIIVNFGLELTALCVAGSSRNDDGTIKYDMAVQAELPAEAVEWFTINYVQPAAKEVDTLPAVKA